MKTYEGYSSSPDGWNVSSNLELENDGRFSYSEGWTDYTNASLSGGAGETWRRGPGVVIFHTERIYDPIYFPWEVGREVRAIVRDGDLLDFGRGWVLSPPRPQSEYTHKTPVSNTGTEPLTLVLEPWGIRHTLAPGERVQVVAEGRWWKGEPKVESGPGEIVYDGRNGTWATVVPLRPKPKPLAPPHAPVVKTTKPAVRPPVKPPAKPFANNPPPPPRSSRARPQMPPSRLC